MKRKHKQYSRPKRPFDKIRFEEEAKIKEEFGLKNTILNLGSFFVSLFNRLKEIGLEVNSIPDVLSLDKRDYLQRRLQTVLVKKRLARTPKAARQLIVHRKILIGKNAVDSPSYIVPIEMEDKISLKIKNKVENKPKTELEIEKN